MNVISSNGCSINYSKLPRCIVLISGKRKSGKDYVSEKLVAGLGDEGVIVRLSGPLKAEYARMHNLDLDELLSSGPYKEIYRKDMVCWSEQLRQNDPGYFCRLACPVSDRFWSQMDDNLLAQDCSSLSWIVSDVRRRSDLDWFDAMFGRCGRGVKLFKIRIDASDEVRESRGWVFERGVDDAETECGLDGYDAWDLSVENNDAEGCSAAVEKIEKLIKFAEKS